VRWYKNTHKHTQWTIELTYCKNNQWFIFVFLVDARHTHTAKRLDRQAGGDPPNVVHAHSTHTWPLCVRWRRGRGLDRSYAPTSGSFWGPGTLSLVLIHLQVSFISQVMWCEGCLAIDLFTPIQFSYAPPGSARAPPAFVGWVLILWRGCRVSSTYCRVLTFYHDWSTTRVHIPVGECMLVIGGEYRV